MHLIDFFKFLLKLIHNYNKEKTFNARDLFLTLSIKNITKFTLNVELEGDLNIYFIDKNKENNFYIAFS